MPDIKDDLEEFTIAVRGGCSKALKASIESIQARDITEACRIVGEKCGPEFVAIPSKKNTSPITD